MGEKRDKVGSGQIELGCLLRCRSVPFILPWDCISHSSLRLKHLERRSDHLGGLLKCRFGFSKSGVRPDDRIIKLVTDIMMLLVLDHTWKVTRLWGSCLTLQPESSSKQGGGLGS